MIAKGSQTTEAGGSRKLYEGVGIVKVLALNPNKAELEKIYGREIESEPNYLSSVEVDGKQVPTVRLSFVVETDPDKNNGISVKTNHTYFLRKVYQKGNQSGKYKVIDKYGRTAWVTKEEAQAHAIPQYANGPANIDADYRPCYEGEEELTLFIKNLLNIPNVVAYTNGVWTPNPRVTPADCEVRLDTIDKFFTGDWKELTEALSYQPENTVKLLFGVRNDTDTNRQLQTTYTRMSYKTSVSDYSKLAAAIAESKEKGGLSNVEFEICDLKEYVVNPTNLQPSLEQVAQANVAGEDTPW